MAKKLSVILSLALILSVQLWSQYAYSGSFKEYADCVKDSTGGKEWEESCLSAALVCLKSKNPTVKAWYCAKVLVCGAEAWATLAGCLSVFCYDPQPYLQGERVGMGRIRITNTRSFFDTLYVSGDYICALQDTSIDPWEPSWCWKRLQVTNVSGGLNYGVVDTLNTYAIGVISGQTVTITFDTSTVISAGHGAILYSVMSQKTTFDSTGAACPPSDPTTMSSSGAWYDYVYVGSAPLLSQWGLITLSLLLIATVFFVWHRRRQLSIPVALPFFLLVFALSFYLSSGI